MTVSSSTSEVSYDCDGVTNNFPVPFYFLADGDLIVQLVDTFALTVPPVVLILGVDYSVTGSGNQAGGAVTTTVVYPIGKQLQIARIVPVTQLTSYQQNDAFPAKVTERALDKLTMICQQISKILGGGSTELSRVLMLGPADINGNGAYRGNNNRISDLRDPVMPQDAATKAYTDAADAFTRSSAENGDESVREYVESLFSSITTPTFQSLVPVTFRDGTDFTAGSSDSVTLSETDAQKTILDVFFDTAFQSPATWTLGDDGVTLKFDDVIPEGVGQVNVNFFAPSLLGVFQQAGFGTISRTFQSRMRDTVSVKDFGAKGDGVADDTAAIQASLNELENRGGGEIRIPSGVYKLSSELTFSMPTVTASITIQGSGADVTQLVWEGGEGLEINFDGAYNSAHIRDLSLLTGSQGAGRAISLNQMASSIPDPGNTAQSDISNVTIRGSDGISKNNYWSTAVYDFGVSNVNLTNAFIAGNGAAAYSTFGSGVELNGTEMLPTVVFNFTGCTFNALNVGIVYGNWVQGVSISQCNFTGDGIGINVPAGITGTDQLYVGGSQFNCITGMNILTSCQASMINGCLFIIPQAGVALNLPVVSLTTISGNTFSPTSYDNTLGNGIVVGTTVLVGATITGNSFYHIPETAVFLTPESSLNNVQSNSYADNGNNTVNQGTGNMVGGGSA